MDRAAVFATHRPRLYGIAYRMLGSRAEAEDMLQEAYLRWHQADAERVHTPEAWLVTTVSRLCIDRLRAVRAERDAYIGPWLPEPLVEEPFAPPDAHAELASDLSVAFLVVLERLAPEERAALLLHDVFDCDYADISRILGKSEPACRQIVHRARERARADRPRFRVSEAAHAQLLERFVAALKAQDKDTLLGLFAPDATWTSDGGGKQKAARKVLEGADRVARFALAIWDRYYSAALADRALVNGQRGLIMSIAGRVVSTISIDTDGSRIRAVHTVLNPDKLKGIERPSA
ncbi:MAG TPA: RNA polymerase sigma-70 factor [Casimicrobiaceae bacterium]|jgi:RNA polymerase sigma-70 factor, ECF subfamily|nr:RNA polymerase sigma-70 factor [Casimicrobiaceae bacterium]